MISAEEVLGDVKKALDICKAKDLTKRDFDRLLWLIHRIRGVGETAGKLYQHGGTEEWEGWPKELKAAYYFISAEKVKFCAAYSLGNWQEILESMRATFEEVAHLPEFQSIDPR